MSTFFGYVTLSIPNCKALFSICQAFFCTMFTPWFAPESTSADKGFFVDSSLLRSRLVFGCHNSLLSTHIVKYSISRYSQYIMSAMSRVMLISKKHPLILVLFSRWRVPVQPPLPIFLWAIKHKVFFVWLISCLDRFLPCLTYLRPALQMQRYVSCHWAKNTTEPFKALII